MKKTYKKGIIACLAFVLLVFAVFTFAVISSHYPYVATVEGEILTYNNEPYIRIDRRIAEEIIGAEIELGEILGEIKYDFVLLDYIISNHPIQAIKGDDDLNFIAQSMWQSPTAIYCKKEFYETLNY